jgi:DNA polymerase elongation subunit (family B)
MSDAKYVQAFLSEYEGGEAVLVDRAGGYDDRPRLERAVVFWSCFVRAPLPKDVLRELKTAPSVKSIRVEKGGWLRISFVDRLACRAGCSYLEDVKGIRTYEGNVSPLRRLLVERKITPARPRSVYFDIETDPRPGLANKLQMRILIVVFEDFDTHEQTEFVLEEDSDDGERKLLLRVWSFLERYDQVIAWNGDRFDEPVLKARTKKHQIPVEPKRLLWLDHMKVFEKQNAMGAASGEEKQSLALAAVCASLGLEGKDDFDVLTVYDEWAAGGERRARAVRYCAKDVSRMPAIEGKTGYLALFRTLCESTGLFASSVSIGPSHQVESFLLRLAQERGLRFPTRFVDKDEDAEEDDKAKFKGALVVKPSKAGIHKTVHVIDFARMYPSVILSLNLSPETKIDKPDLLAGFPLYLRGSAAYHEAERKMRDRRPPEGCAVSSSGSWFKTEPIGILPLAIEEGLRLRVYWDDLKKTFAPGTPEWKDADRRSAAYKVFVNGFFGVVGSEGSMFFDVEVAESITQTGVALIEATNERAVGREWTMDHLYGDTDSSFFLGVSIERMKEFVDGCNATLYPAMVEKLGGKNRVKVEFEKSFKRLVFTWNESEARSNAKKYCGSYLMFKGKPAREDSEPEIRGLEYRRGDSLRLTRTFQKEVVDLLIKRECETIEEFDALIERWKKHIFEDALAPDDVKISKRIASSLEDYAQKPKKSPVSLGYAVVRKVEKKGLVVDSVFGAILGAKKVLVPFGDVHEKCAVFDAAKDDRSARSLVGFEFELLVNEYGLGPTHVQVARMLEAMGTPVRQGEKVEYVVVDGSTSPKTIVPFEAWDGKTIDRVDLWLQVWVASRRLLKGAFPGVDWDRHNVDYPKVPRPPKEKRAPAPRKRKVSLSQGSLFDGGEK